MCNVVEFHDDLGGTNENLLEDLCFHGDPDDFRPLARAVLLRSLPAELSFVVEEFVTELLDFETWRQIQDAEEFGIQE